MYINVVTTFQLKSFYSTKTFILFTFSFIDIVGFLLSTAIPLGSGPTKVDKRALTFIVLVQYITSQLLRDKDYMFY